MHIGAHRCADGRTECRQHRGDVQRASTGSLLCIPETSRHIARPVGVNLIAVLCCGNKAEECAGIWNIYAHTAIQARLMDSWARVAELISPHGSFGADGVEWDGSLDKGEQI